MRKLEKKESSSKGLSLFFYFAHHGIVASPKFGYLSLIVVNIEDEKRLRRGHDCCPKEKRSDVEPGTKSPHR